MPLKICMMISGLCNNKCYRDIKSIRTFCRMFDIDVFLVIDSQDRNDNIMLGTLKPLSVIHVESNPELCSTYNMFYKIMKGFELVTDYETKNNIKYDVFIRCRYDLNFVKVNKSFQFQSIESNTIYTGEKMYYSSNHLVFPIMTYILGLEGYVYDEFFFGDREAMRIVTSMYKNILDVKECKVSAETILFNHLKSNQLKTRVLPIYYTYTLNYNDFSWLWYQWKKYNAKAYGYVTNKSVTIYICNASVVIALFVVIHYYRKMFFESLYGLL